MEWIDLVELCRLLGALHPNSNDQQDVNFLNQVLTSKEMTNLLRVHKKISTIVGKPSIQQESNGVVIDYEPEMIVPTVSNVHNISCEVIEILQSYVQRSGSRYSRELIFLLQRPAVQVWLILLFLSQQNFDPNSFWTEKVVHQFDFDSFNNSLNYLE